MTTAFFPVSFTLYNSDYGIGTVSSVTLCVRQSPCHHIRTMAVNKREDPLKMVPRGRAPVLFEAVIVTEGGLSQPKESVFQKLCLSGQFLVDGFMFRKHLPLMPTVNIGVFGIQLLVHPDLQMVLEKPHLGGLTDKVGTGAVTIGINGHAEIGVDQAIDLFEKATGDLTR